VRILKSKSDIVALSGDLSNDVAEQVEAALDPVRDSAVDVPVVDVSGVTTLSNRCLGVLVALWADLKVRGRWFELRASDALWNTLQDRGVGRIFLPPNSGSVTSSSMRTKHASRKAGPAGLGADAKSVLAGRSLKSIEVEIERYVATIAQLTDSVDNAQSKVKARAAERDKLFAELRCRNADMATLREQSAAALAEARADTAAMRLSRDEIATELVRLKKEYKQFRKDAEASVKLAGTVDGLNEEIRASLADVARLEDTLSSARNEAARAGEAFSAVEAELRQTQREREKSRENFAAFTVDSEERVRAALNEARELAAERDALQAHIAHIQRELTALRAAPVAPSRTTRSAVRSSGARPAKSAATRARRPSTPTASSRKASKTRGQKSAPPARHAGAKRATKKRSKAKRTSKKKRR
jgi:uncharacterized coiled-coil DUF342 family protein/anti-anti-sigma regulatory factor